MAWLDANPAVGFPAVAGLGLLVGSFLNVVILRTPPRLEWQWKRCLLYTSPSPRD